jgi:hypothetical protein
MPQAVALVLALVALVLLPCLVALLVMNADRWQERWLMLRLERALADAPAEQRFILDAMSRSTQPPIEQIASDLRRLGRQRLGLATRNPIWFEAVRRAYDDRLQLACGCLGIRHHLAELDGLDLEIERLRVEGELRAAGLFFGAGERGRRQDRW